MDKKAYLDQISATVRPEKQNPLKKMMSSKFARIFAGLALVLVVIIIIGSVLSGNSGPKDQAIALKLHLDTTLDAISDYQPSVKSSNLRSSSASLYSVLSNANKDLTDFVTEQYDFKDNKVDKKLTEEEQLHADGLEADLFNAKINGILDRIYAHKMAYEISLITAQEEKLLATSKDETLRAILNTSLTSLNNLYDSFNDFSETK